MHEYRDEELARALSELPAPPTSDDFFAYLRARITLAPQYPRRSTRRRITLTAALVGSALIVGSFAGAELAGSTRAATPTPVPAFTPALGWNTVETNDRPPAPNQPDPLAWAANVPFAPQDALTAWPMATLKDLPPDGIVIVVVGPFSYSESQQPAELTVPVRIEDMYFHRNNYETQPAPNVSYYVISGRINASEAVIVNVWMGSNDPAPAMKAAADEELARLTLPS